MLLPICAMAGNGYINVFIGKNFGIIDQKKQTINFGSFTNRYVPNNNTESSNTGGLEAGYQFNVSRHFQDQLGLSFSKSQGMTYKGTENRMINQPSPPPDMRYRFKMSLQSLVVANTFQVPFGRFSLRFLSQMGVVFNRVYDWVTYPIDGVQPPSAGNPFKDNTKVNFAAGVGAGFSVRLTHYMNIGADYLFRYVGDNKFGPQSGQTTKDRFSVKDDAVNTTYINLQFIF